MLLDYLPPILRIPPLPLQRHLKLIIFVFAAVFIIFMEEYFIGSWDNFVGNSYTRIEYKPIERVRDNFFSTAIVVLVIVERTDQLAEYRLALGTLQCYCVLHRYPFTLLDLSKNETLRRKCPQEDVSQRMIKSE